MMPPEVLALLAAVNSWPGAVVAVAVLVVPQVISAWNSWRARRDARVIREQTENSHADAEHPNLRDELTATRAASEAATEAARCAAEAAERVAVALAEHTSHAEVVDERRDAWQASIEEQVERLRRPILSWRL